jgi:hypothetical protein
MNLLELLAYFGGTIYEWDLNIVYGRVLKKLNEIIADMEELRNCTIHMILKM